MDVLQARCNYVIVLGAEVSREQDLYSRKVIGSPVLIISALVPISREVRQSSQTGYGCHCG
jgi:hypothetical protein